MTVQAAREALIQAKHQPPHRAASIILEQAFQLRASDIHLCPQNMDNIWLRYRIDGHMVNMTTLHSTLYQPILVHIKVMANLDITTTHLPQDGRFTLTTDHLTHCRINLCPTIFGQRAVIRMIADNPHINLSQLGLSATQIQAIHAALTKKQGMILTVGPTGSGKTVTLYSLLRHISDQSYTIMTACDPVEIYQDHISQTNLAPHLGLDYPTLIKTFLRQDPDALMLGEIRDRDTLTAAIQAATTGHLVLSSMHTAYTYSTWSRIKHLGSEPDMIPNWLNLVIAQRLLRRICSHCHKQSAACTHCHDGYRGVVAVFALRTGHEIAHSQDNQHTDIQAFQQQAATHITQGITDAAEVSRVLGS
jgi:protein transport protein HofB